MARRGGFSTSLDPFGGGSGSLARYNLGETVSSLEELEAYTTAVAWANGQASDEEYLASLQRMVDLAPPGTRDRVAAENKLDDAKYSIGRNKLASKVNRADSLTERKAALEELLRYDEARLKGMKPDNEAYRDQQDRVSGVRVELRQSQYSDLVTKVNNGHASTDDLIGMATRFAAQSGNDPDADDWAQTVVELKDRKADEELADAYQAYQHNRMSGKTLLAKLDARMAGLDPHSSKYKELARQREDLADNVKARNAALEEAKVQGQRQSGKMSDKSFLAYLKRVYADSEPGTTDQIQAGNRLREFVFSLGEDKLRYDVERGKRPVSDLVRFYRTARAGMDPGSERYRALTLAIERLTGRGGAGGGGGGGGGGGRGTAGKGISLGPKALGGPSILQDLLGTNKAPPGFGDLFRVNVQSVASRHWWDNNLRSMVDAFQRGDNSWVYYDKRGKAYRLDFDPSMMHQMDMLNLQYAHQGLAGARNAKEAQTWVGRVITATKSVERRGSQVQMDQYTKTFAALERAKEQALAGGRWAEYANLTNEQRALARDVLWLNKDDPTDVALSNNPYLTADQKDRLTADLAKIAPQNLDEQSPYYHPEGDPVIGMMQDGRIETAHDSDGNISAAELRPEYGYVTQTDRGIQLVTTDPSDPAQLVYDDQSGTMVPAYLKNTQEVTIRYGGEDVRVRQPVVQVDQSIPVYRSFTGTPTAPRGGLRGLQPGAAIPGPATSVDPYIVNGSQIKLALQTITTYENGKKVNWVSIDGKEWLRFTGEGQAPRVVIDQSVTWDSSKGSWMRNGQEVDPLKEGLAHWWGAKDSQQAGKAWGYGAPGVGYDSRMADPKTGLDTRAEWIVRSENVMQQRLRYGGPSGPTRGDDRDNMARYPVTPSTMDTRDQLLDEKAFIRTARAADAAAAAAEARDRQLDAPTRAGMDWGGTPWANRGEVRPISQRPQLVSPKSVASKPIPRGPLISEDPRDLGVKPTPNPTLRVPSTPSLAPVNAANRSSLKPLAKLKTIKKAKAAPKPKPRPSMDSNADLRAEKNTRRKVTTYVAPVKMHEEGEGGLMGGR